jgi:methionyl-tRNA formyltransferase
MEETKWIAFFSQTGSEIADISESIGRWPDRIITNERPEHLRTIDSRIEERNYWTLPNKPSEENYLELLTYFPDAIVTLHGWLRIIPKKVCERSYIYNGHPGLITTYPELKGKDPQIRAFEGKYKTMGCVLHRVSPGVDEGKILLKEEFNAYGLDLDGVFRTLRDRSLYMWCKFLDTALLNRNYYNDN